MRICPECNKQTEDLICPVCSSKTITEDEYVKLHADPDNLIGKVLMDRYKVIRLVGIGGMGNVYEARHQLFDKRFAVKVIKKHMVDNDEAVKRFQREALLASKLDHPNIVKVYDFGETESAQQFILMEFVDGESLRDLLKREKRLSPFRSAGLFLQMAKALEYAHNKRLVHRDLKPDNIFIRHINGEDFVKIVDFGVAKLLHDDSGRTLTKEGYTPGTPEYMSPEQVLAKHDVDGRSDLYSLGLIVYEMLTGVRPYKRDTPLAAAVAHLNESVPPFDKDLKQRLPDGLEPLIFQLIQRKPSKRPESASVVIAKLKQLRFDGASVQGGDGDRLQVRTPYSTKSLTPFNTSDLTKRLDQTRQEEWRPVDSKIGLYVMFALIGAGIIVAGGVVGYRHWQGQKVETEYQKRVQEPVIEYPKPVERGLDQPQVLYLKRRLVASIPDMKTYGEDRIIKEKALRKSKSYKRKIKRRSRAKKATQKKATQPSKNNVIIPRW